MWRSANRPLGRRQQRVQVLSRQAWRVWGLIVGFFVLVWGIAAWFGISETRKASASDSLPEIVVAANSDFTYDLAQLEPGQTRFFTYPTSSSERSRLLVTRDSKGVIRASFASCTVCYSDRREHRLRKGKLICGRCQSAMRLGDQNERLTADKGCVAVPVPFSVENNEVRVRARAITEGAKTLINSNNGTVQEDAASKNSRNHP